VFAKKLSSSNGSTFFQQPPVLFLAFTFWSLGLTYPLAGHLFTHIPLGAEPVATVPLFNLWSLQWNIDQLVRGYPHYWDAPIFTPHPGTFAFSETQPLTALLAAPLWLGGASPALGYNVVVWLFLTLNGWFAYGLLRSWGVIWGAALPAALLTQSLPFVAQEMGVLQLVAIFGLLWSLFFLHRLLRACERGQWQWRAVFGLALGTPVTFFTCGYYGLISLIFLPLAFVTQLKRRHLTPPLVGQLLVVGLLVLGLSAPFLLAQQQRLARYGFIRSQQTVENNSARLSDYTNFLDNNLLYSQILGLESNRGQRLFPGVGLVLLAIFGLMGPFSKRVKLYLLLAALLALLLSLGLRLEVGSVRPFLWLREYLPGFKQLRSPFRFAVAVQLHLALLAGFGLHTLWRWLPRPGQPLLGLLVGLSLLEVVALPLPLQPLPPPQPDVAWQRWLAQREHPPQLVMLPFAQTNRVADFEQTVHWMLESRYFQGQMANGYSGFFPPDHATLRQQMLQFPTPAAIDLLRDIQIEYVVVHHALPHAPPPDAMTGQLPLLFFDPQTRVAIYSLQ